MIVAVVAVAGEGLLQAGVLELWLGELHAGVGRYHERILEIIPEEVRKLRLSIPSIKRQNRALKLLLHRWHIVINLEHHICSLVVHGVCEDLVISADRHRILLSHALVLKVIAAISTLANECLILFLRATKDEVVTTIKSV